MLFLNIFFNVMANTFLLVIMRLQKLMIIVSQQVDCEVTQPFPEQLFY